MVFSLTQPRVHSKNNPRTHVSLLCRVSGSRALKHTKLPAPVGRNRQVLRPQSTPRLVGVIASFHLAADTSSDDAASHRNCPEGCEGLDHRDRLPRPNARATEEETMPTLSICLPCLSVRPLDRGQGKTSSWLTLTGHI